MTSSYDLNKNDKSGGVLNNISDFRSGGVGPAVYK